MLISVFLSSFLGKLDIQSQPPPKEPVPEVREVPKITVLKNYVGEVTGYSSREEETDDTPFITASGLGVRWGTIATNAHPFGTKIRFPEVYQDKIFIVEDRMNARYKNRMDIWFPHYSDARRFGLRNLKVEIVEEGKADVASL